MADNLELNTGSGGETIATDQLVGGAHAQYVKLMDGTADSAEKIGGDAANGLDVDVTRSALPSGAATSAKQDTQTTALGTLALETGGNLATIAGAIKAEDAAHSSGHVGVMALAVRSAAAADLSAGGTDGDYEPLQVDANGKLHVNPGTVTVASHAVTNAGTFAVQVDGNALTALQLIDDPVIADDAAFTPATTKVMMAGFEADESGTDSVDEGDGGAARMTLDRKLITTPQPHTTGGLTTAMFSGSDGSSILVATAQVVKASAGQLYGYYAYNPEAAVSFVHFYNTAAASVTVGTTNPLFTLAIPAGSAANLMFTHGVLFSNAGWSVAATTTAGGTGAPATGVSLVAWYI